MNKHQQSPTQQNNLDPLANIAPQNTSREKQENLNCGFCILDLLLSLLQYYPLLGMQQLPYRSHPVSLITQVLNQFSDVNYTSPQLHWLKIAFALHTTS